MAKAQAKTVYTWEDSAVSLMARVAGNDGTYITQSDIGSIALSVFDISGDEPVAVTGFNGKALTVAEIVFDSLQNGSRWARDATGYNFRHLLPAEAVPNAGNYRVEYVFTPTAGPSQSFPVVFDLVARKLHSS